MWNILKFRLKSFRKIGLILLVATFGSYSAQDVELTCVFGSHLFDDYGCLLVNITVLDPEANIVFVGQHLDNLTDSDVLSMVIFNSNTPFMMPQMFTTFPNMDELLIMSSNLQSINVPSSAQLFYLILYDNNISRIESGSLRGQSRLTYLELSSNNIQEIEEDAFVDLEALNTLVLIDNQLQEIRGTTLHNLTNLIHLDFWYNNITHIGENTLSGLTNLLYLYFDNNQIEAVHPRFASDLASLQYVDLVGNSCVNRYFELSNEQSWREMNNALQTCFNNYNGTIPELRTVTMQFTGNLAIFDEFGNIIARV